MDRENPYATSTNESQREAPRTLADPQTPWLFAACAGSAVALLFQLSETTTRGFGLRSGFGLPVFLTLDHGSLPFAVEFQWRPAVVNLAVVVAISISLFPAVKPARWFMRHKIIAATLALLAIILGVRDLIVVSDTAMWFIDAATFLALLCLPWAIAHYSNSYALALLIPFATTIAWGATSRAAELYLRIYDTQSILSVIQRSAFALLLSTLAFSSIFLRRRRSNVPTPDT